MSWTKAERESVFKCLFSFISFQHDRNNGDDVALFEMLDINQEMQEEIITSLKHITKNLKVLDGIISKYLRNWSIDRLALVDRTILYVGVYELVHKKTPAAIVINESVNLAKKYGTEKSPSFVNAVLDKIKEDKILLY